MKRIIRFVKNERGAQALEWVALGLVVLAVMGAIVTGIGNNTSIWIDNN